MKPVIMKLQLSRLYCSPFIFLFIFFSTTLFAQQQNSVGKGIYTILDKNADNLLRKSRAYSVSIGLVKDGKFIPNITGNWIKGKVIKLITIPALMLPQ